MPGSAGSSARPGLPRRPCQTTPGQQMQVDVEYRLPGVAVGVEHGAESTLGVAMLGSDGGGTPEHRAYQRVVSGREVVDRRDVLRRHDQHVQWRLWIDVAKGDERVVPVNHLRGDRAGDYAAEQAVAHVNEPRVGRGSFAGCPEDRSA